MEWSDSQVIRDIISVVATQGWEKLLEENDPKEGIDRLVARFTIPLQGAQAECDKIKEEMLSVLQYAVRFISLSTMDYRAVWWRIFNAPSSSEWTNSLSCFSHYPHPMGNLSDFFTTECDQHQQEEFCQMRRLMQFKILILCTARCTMYIYLRREDGSCREADQSLSLTSSLVDLAT